MPTLHIKLRVLMYPYKDTDNIKSNIFSPLGLTVIAETGNKELAINRSYKVEGILNSDRFTA